MRKLAIALFAIAAACSDETSDTTGDDHSVDRLVVEGQQIVDLLGDDRLSDAITSTSGFRRLGVLWDATEEGTLEVRTSLDGMTWSEWAAPAIVDVDQVAHTGHLDAITGMGPAGSTDADPLARFYQLRAPAGKALPTFLVIEPLLDIPAEVVDDPSAATEALAEDEADLVAMARPTGIGNLTVHSRTEWHARPPRCNGGSMTPNRATIHHTVTPTNDSMSVPARLRQIQAFHMFTRGWCDIGYNYLVSRDGRVWRGRGARTVGAHVENDNSGNVGVSFIGTYTSTAPTQTQMCSAAKLLRRLHLDYSALVLTRSDVKGHRQVGSTSCPGNALYNRIDAILRKARGGCDVN